MQKDEGTIAKTLWSETILEVLYESLKKNRSDAAIREILVEVRDKGFDSDYIIDRVNKKVGPTATTRVRRMLMKMHT
jgi:hypothetical protein